MAGLVGGDSDSSALTQESGDESPQRESIATGTDAATEDGDEEFVEAPGASPGASLTIPTTLCSHISQSLLYLLGVEGRAQGAQDEEEPVVEGVVDPPQRRGGRRRKRSRALPLRRNCAEPITAQGMCRCPQIVQNSRLRDKIRLSSVILGRSWKDIAARHQLVC